MSSDRVLVIDGDSGIVSRLTSRVKSMVIDVEVRDRENHCCVGSLMKVDVREPKTRDWEQRKYKRPRRKR